MKLAFLSRKLFVCGRMGNPTKRLCYKGGSLDYSYNRLIFILIQIKNYKNLNIIIKTQVNPEVLLVNPVENPNDLYSIGTYPVSVCDNIQISRSRIYQGEV